MLGLRTVIYKVADLEKATQWYSKAFEQEPYFQEVFYVGFSIQGFELGLQPDKLLKNDRKTSQIAYWGVQNIEKEYQRLIQLGASPEEAPNEVGDRIYVATVKDPWNNAIGLIYNPHFKIAE